MLLSMTDAIKTVFLSHITMHSAHDGDAVVAGGIRRQQHARDVVPVAVQQVRLERLCMHAFIAM